LKSARYFVYIFFNFSNQSNVYKEKEIDDDDDNNDGFYSSISRFDKYLLVEDKDEEDKYEPLE
jgi:hypothetical protein